jgi:hypothetical protein
MIDVRTLTTAPSFYPVVLAGGFMLREFLVHPKTRRIDWWMIALLLVSLLSFASATILVIHPV